LVEQATGRPEIALLGPETPEIAGFRADHGGALFGTVSFAAAFRATMCSCAKSSADFSAKY